MKSQTPRNLAELVILLFGGLLLSVHGAKHVVAVISATSTLPASAYGAGDLVGQLIGAACPLVIGVGLFIIAYRRGRSNHVQARAV